jgi:hypothetical protein
VGLAIDEPCRTAQLLQQVPEVNELVHRHAQRLTIETSP